MVQATSTTLAPNLDTFKVSQVLAGRTVLVTYLSPPSFPSFSITQHLLKFSGGAGFIGSALLHRLVDPSLSIRRVYTIIRGHGKDPITRLPQTLLPHVAKVDENGNLDSSPLVVLSGDCFLPGFGLGEREQKWLEEVEIVIHTAGDTRFTLPLPKAIRAIVSPVYYIT
jgi:Male sterility protein